MGDSCVERIQALGRERHGDDWEAHWEAQTRAGRLVQGSGQRAAGTEVGGGSGSGMWFQTAGMWSETACAKGADGVCKVGAVGAAAGAHSGVRDFDTVATASGIRRDSKTAEAASCGTHKTRVRPGSAL
jgi:hypothetical protein